MPKVIESDNGPTFVSQVSQGLAKILGTDWKLHYAYHSLSLGQVERMNRTLKETLTKLAIETGGLGLGDFPSLCASQGLKHSWAFQPHPL